MTGHKAVTDQVRERASFYRLGLLESAEASAFEHHLAECDICRTEAREAGDVVAELAFGLVESRPGPRVREELLRRTAPRPVLVRHGEGNWKATGFDGVEAKQLFVDATTGSVTSLVRMAPRATYPPHRHAGHEHCYVLEGDLVFDDHTLFAGDFEVNAPFTGHSPVTTVNGCLLLLTNNQSDQLLAH
jgi:anti-sigma factor ChrR (cupin superfamily)